MYRAAPLVECVYALQPTFEWWPIIIIIIWASCWVEYCALDCPVAFFAAAAANRNYPIVQHKHKHITISKVSPTTQSSSMTDWKTWVWEQVNWAKSNSTRIHKACVRIGKVKQWIESRQPSCWRGCFAELEEWYVLCWLRPYRNNWEDWFPFAYDGSVGGPFSSERLYICLIHINYWMSNKLAL